LSGLCAWPEGARRQALEHWVARCAVQAVVSD